MINIKEINKEYNKLENVIKSYNEIDSDYNIYLAEVCVAVLGSLGLEVPHYNGTVYNGLRKLEKVN